MTFLAEVERCKDSILEHPVVCTPVRADVPRRILASFP
jgi:hypothetical protein